MVLTVEQLAKRLNARLLGDGTAPVHAVNTVTLAEADEVTFISSPKLLSDLPKSKATAVIIGREIKCENFAGSKLIVGNVNAALIEALTVFAPKLKAPCPGIDPTAKIADNAKIADSAAVAAYTVIAENVRIGENTIIGTGCKIGENSNIGNNCRFDSNVVVYHNCRIGNNVIIQANSVIGSTGFGYYFIDGAHRLIPHNGGVIIEDFVEIGANTCIDRAKFGNTGIGAGTKIDNLVQIAHNVQIGRCCIVAGQTGISGSTKIGDGVIFGGRAGAVDNIEIGAGTMIGATSTQFQTAPPGSQLFGTPAQEKNDALRVLALTKRLPKFAEQLKQLSQRIKKLEASENHKK
ncbi:MAG: UDP-3-O-(3-hydroxymyristoyl)glucosamine N-acyltransferase [Planctomycetota bacterium]|jgi:UDP-3-O-[3-hydroxymyristoyl] glucosamine N-acyltransferase